MCLSGFGVIRQFRIPVSWLRDFAGSCEGASFRMLRRGPGGRSGSIWWTSNHYEKRISGRYLCGKFIFMWLRRGTSMACRTVRYVCAIAYLCGLITWDSGWLISVIWVFFLVHLQWTRITQEFVKCIMTQMKWIMPNVCDSTYLCRFLSCDSGWMNTMHFLATMNMNHVWNIYMDVLWHRHSAWWPCMVSVTLHI